MEKQRVHGTRNSLPQRLQRAWLQGILAVCMALLVAACGGQASPTIAKPAVEPTTAPTESAPPTSTKEAWEIEWQQTIAAAQKEGKLVWSGGGEVGRSFRDLVPIFEREFGISVTLSGTRGSQEANRILAEQRVGKNTTDIFMGGLTSGEVLIGEGILDPVSSDFILPAVKDEKAWLNGRHHYADRDRQYAFLYSASPRGAGLIVNTKLVNPNEITSFWDLLDPKYKGLIVSGFLGEEGNAGSVAEYYGNPEIGSKWLEGLVLETDLVMIDDTRTAKDWIITGKKAIAIFVGTVDDMYGIRDSGAPVEVMDYRFPLKEGNVLAGGGSASMIMLVKNAPSPNARKVFTNWWLSPEGQLAMHKAYGQRQTLRLDVPNDMLNPEAKIHPGLQYIYPQSDPAFQEIRGEALTFARELSNRWRAKQ